MQSNNAIEIGMFKLKAQVSIEQATAAYQNMVDHFLSKQIAWQGQSLILLEDGTLIDLAWAQNIEAAKSICNLWMENSNCLAFLALIEPISMQFGQVLVQRPLAS